MKYKGGYLLLRPLRFGFGQQQPASSEMNTTALRSVAGAHGSRSNGGRAGTVPYSSCPNVVTRSSAVVTSGRDLLLCAQRPCQPGALFGLRGAPAYNKSLSRSRRSALATTAFAQPQSPPVREPEGNPGAAPLPLPKTVENVADDPKLANPLERHQRLSTGWIGVVMEDEGIVVQSTWEAHRHAWLTVAEEEGKPPPLQWALKRAEGMKAEQVIQEVFHWTRNPAEVRRVASRKEELYCEAMKGTELSLMPGVLKLLETCQKNDVPVALASSEPEERVLTTLEAVGVSHLFSAVVTAGDCQYSRPDPEPYLYAAQLIKRPPVRCVVIGGSNASIEGAQDAGMQSVIVANRTPMFELTSGDLVVRDLSDISFVNLKQLFQLEQLTSGSEDPEPEMELEEEPEQSMYATQTIMSFDNDFL